VVESGNRVKEPDIVAQAAFVEIAEVRVQGVAVKINIFLGIARSDPSFLNRDALVGNAGRKRPCRQPPESAGRSVRT